MTALQTINQGTAPAGSDGDTVRSAFTKVNSNVGVMNTQAALTSATTITAAQALTSAHVGRRVNINLSTAGTINMPVAATCAADQVTLLRNIGATVATLAITTGSNDTVALSKLNPGETVLMDTDGVHAWNVLMRGRTNSDNEIINGGLSVGGAISSPSGTVSMSGAVSATGAVSGASVSATGAVSGASASFAGDVASATSHTTGDASVGGNLGVAGAATLGSAVLHGPLTYPDGTQQGTAGLLGVNNLSDVPSKKTAQANLSMGKVLLSTQVAAGTSGFVTFTGLDDTTYDFFEIECSEVYVSVGGQAVFLQASIDGTTWLANSNTYADASSGSNHGGTTYTLGHAGNAGGILLFGNFGAGAACSSDLRLSLRRFGNAGTTIKHVLFDACGTLTDGYLYHTHGMGHVQTAGAESNVIKAAKLFFASGNISGTFSLYGIRHG